MTTLTASETPSAESMAGHPASHPPRIAPTWATLVLTWVNNIGAATALMGIYFITKERFGFTQQQNLLLGLLQGVMYVGGALTAGPILRQLAKPGGASTRGLLACIHVALAGLCALPWLTGSAWSIWVMIGVYSPLTGWLWPIIESYLSAGRTDEGLRRATGLFNVGWASSQVAAFWLLAPFIQDKEQAPIALAVLGLSHLLTLPVVFALPHDPAPHGHGHAPRTPDEEASMRRLLHGFRLAIVLTYVLYSAVAPLFAHRFTQLGVEPGWATRLASTWMIARVILFIVMQRWHGWHGHRGTVVWGLALLVGGFAACLTVPTWPIMLGALAAFGAGMGVVYSAAFYYAMEVGSAGVDAGGKHEALIGAGYTLGPFAALGATAFIPAQSSDSGYAGILVILLCVAVVFAVGIARIMLRPASRTQ